MAQEKNKYTKPEMRERLKDRIMAGSKGGKAGEWSARKAQMLAKAYKEKVEVTKEEKAKNKKILKRWGKEKWMTREEYEKNN